VRKRIAIAVVAVLVIAVAAYVVSQPHKGTIDYHKREYLEALNDTTLRDRGRHFLGWVARKRPPSGRPEPSKRLLTHERTLVALGYLERREFIISNRPAAYLILAHPNLPECVRIEEPATNILAIVAPRDEMPIWEDIVRKADVP
jgi:hypothetical protein